MVQILSSDVLPEIRMTVDEYLAADLPEGQRYELVEGVVEVSPVPGVSHDVVVARLARVFHRYQDERPDLVDHITQRSALALPGKRTVREPDFAVYSPEQSPARFGNWKASRPTLIVEVVSPGQAERDHEEKALDYWDAAIEEYWVIDAGQRLLTVMSRGTTAWATSRYGADQRYRPERFPGLEIELAALFAALA